MKFYIDIALLPSDDIGIHFLWSKVMMQVHLALVEIQDENKNVPVAVSFPNYREKSKNKTAFIGNKLRLLANDDADFSRLNINRWLVRLEDYIHVKSVSPINQNEIQGFEAFGRRRKPGNVEYLMRRRLKRTNESLEEVKAHYSNFEIDPSFKELPFIRLKSLSGNKDMTLAITRKNVESVVGSKMFNTYGFNLNAALPKF